MMPKGEEHKFVPGVDKFQTTMKLENQFIQGGGAAKRKGPRSGRTRFV